MSLPPARLQPVPRATARVARQAFPKGNAYLLMRDELGAIYRDADFQDLFPREGQPALAPWRLALICVMQFAEGLSDRQAADAVRARIDWKYALGLELNDPGFNFSVLSEFRARLLAGGAEGRLLDLLLARFQDRGWLKARGRQRTDSTHVLAAVRAVNRLESVSEALRAALNAVAAVASEWLRQRAPAEWFNRYSRRAEEHRLPKGQQAREDHAALVGTDGFALLAAVDAPGAPQALRHLPAVGVLRAMWGHQYRPATGPGGPVRWRPAAELPPSHERFDSPYDPQAHYGSKGAICWSGYKVHFTECCGDDEAHLITHVETTAAGVADMPMTAPIQRALAAKGLTPAEHLVDSGYVSAELFLESARLHEGLALIAPTRLDKGWQARAREGFDTGGFAVDWAAKQVRCPEGKLSRRWVALTSATGHAVVSVGFGRRDCQGCPSRTRCTRAPRTGRQLTLRARAQYEVLREQRQRQTTPEWKALYAKRAGIEGTFSQAVRAHGLRRSRYRGQRKTHLQHLATAAAINLGRLDGWLRQRPTAATRRARFAALRG